MRRLTSLSTPNYIGASAPEVQAQQAGNEPPSETAWSRYQAGQARPLGSRSLSRSRPADYERYGGYDRGRPGRRDVSRPRVAHIPCHLEDAVREMLPDPKSGHKNCRADGTFDGLYVDCTFGRGGHTEHILSRLSGSGRLIAFDVDPEAVAVARQLEARDPRFRIAHRPFSELREELRGVQIDGLLVDLGVSSPQLDDRHRGFGVNEDSELDLRMNQQVGIPAWQWLQQCTTEELAWVIREYGEDGDPVMADRIAEVVMMYVEKRKRMKQPMVRSTRELGDYVKIAKQNFDERGQHPAKLTFQALRMFLNQEMQQLDALLEAACESLVNGGKCVVITFKKKECEAVVKFVRQNEEPLLRRDANTSKARWLELYPLMARDSEWSVTFARNPIRPRDEDIKENPRTRSAIVHVLKKNNRIQPKISLEEGTSPRPAQERYKKPDYVPIFKGAESPSGRNQGSDEWRPDEWLPRQDAGFPRPATESVFPPSTEPVRKAAPQPQPQNTQQVFAPASFPPTQSAEPEAQRVPVKAFPGQAQAPAQESSFPNTEPRQQASPVRPPVKAFPTGSTAEAPPSSFPPAQPFQQAPPARPPVKAFPAGQTAEASKTTASPPVKAFPRAPSSQANPQSPTEHRVRFMDGTEEAAEAVAIGECRATVDLEKPNVRRGDLLWIFEVDGEWLCGTAQKGGEPLAWFPRCNVNVFVDI